MAKGLPKPKPVEAPTATTEQPPADKSLEEQASSIFGPNILQLVPRPGEGSGATPTTMSDGLLELAEATGIPVVAQYLSEYAPTGSSVPKGGKIAGQLGALSKTHKFTVEKDGGFLLAHSLLWHRLRDREVPEAAIRRWQKAITGLPLPIFDVSVEMANTSWAQVRGIIANRARWFGMGDLSMIASSEYALKMYASLTAAQQRRLGEGRPVMLSKLKPAQWQTFMQAFEMKARPSYVKAQTPSWPQVSSVSLEPASFAGAPLIAVWNMRFVGSENVGEHVPKPDPAQVNQTEASSGDMAPTHILDRQARLAAFQAAVPVAANALVNRITTEHPEIPRNEVRVYGMYQVTFIFQIGDTEQEVRLWCSMPVQ